MLVPAAAPPVITPPPNLARAVHGGLLGPRQIDWGGLTDYNRDPSPGAGGNAVGGSNYDCLYGSGLDGLQECNNVLVGCDPSQYTNDNYIKECYCTYAMSYLDCYWDKAGTCASYLFGTSDWRDYQTSFFISYCGSIPASVFAQIEPPTEVPLTFTPAKIVTKPGRIAIPTNAVPKYQGTGQLLAGACSASTDYTLVNAGATVYQAAVVGCNGNRPECCPWKVGEMGSGNGAAPAGGTSDDQNKNRVGIDFPQPAENAQAILTGCAQDYYSVSGGCCPVGYWPFTAAVGGQTPCYSSAQNRMTVGTVTVGSEDEKNKDTSKPTSAVVNIVWSMKYEVVDTSSGGLSTGAKAGIGAGIGIVAIALIGLGAWFFVRRRRSKRLGGEKGSAPTEAAAAAAVPQQADPLPPKQPEQFVQQQAGYALPGQLPPGQLPPGQLPPGQFPPVQYPPGTAFMPTPGAPTPSTLQPQHTGASFGAVSSVSAQSGQGLQQNSQPAGYYNGQGYPAPIAESTELPAGQQQQQQQQFYAYSNLQQQQQPQVQPVPGTVPSPPPQAQYQQQFVPQQTGPGPASPQELQGNPQTGPISPQELQGNQQQLPPQQMVWDQNAGGYVLPQQQAQQFFQPQTQPQQPPQQPPQ